MTDIDILIRDAMKGKQQSLLTGFRSIKSKMLLEKTSAKPSKDSDNDLFKKAAAQEIKERIEANSLYTDHKNPHFIENKEIIEHLQAMLPKKLPIAEQQKVILEIMEKIQATSKKDLGLIMAEVTKLKDVLDMKEAVAFIQQKLT